MVHKVHAVAGASCCSDWRTITSLLPPADSVDSPPRRASSPASGIAVSESAPTAPPSDVDAVSAVTEPMDQCTIANAQDAQPSSPAASQPNSTPVLSESGGEAPPAAAATNSTDAIAAAAADTDAPASTNPTPSDPVTASASASPTHEFDPLLVAALARFVDSSLAMYEEGAPARAAVSLGTDVAAPSLALACAALDALLPSRAMLADRKGVRPSRRHARLVAAVRHRLVRGERF